MIKQAIAITNYIGEVFLVNNPPTWGPGKSVDGEFSIPGDMQSGLTHRETRRTYGATLRTNLRYDSFPHGSEIPALQLALRQYATATASNSDLPAVVPFWPAVVNWSDRAASQFQGGLFVVWKSDLSQWEIYDTVEPGWPVATDFWAPALMGYLNPTQPTVVEPNKAAWQVEFKESSIAAYALTVSGASFTAGPQPAGYAAAPKVLPVSPSYQRQGESISVNVIRKNFGFTRNINSTLYPQGATRTNAGDYTLKRDQIASLVQFFAQYAGLGASFWSPGFLQLSSITTTTGAGDTVIHVADTTAILANDYVAFFEAGRLVELKSVASVNTGASTITLTTAIGTIISVLHGVILPLSLARLDKPMLSIKWFSGEVAKTELKLIEVPAEYVIPAGETLGLTLGKLKTRVAFLTFSRDHGNGGFTTWKFTNFEADLTYPAMGAVFVSSDWEIGEIAHSIDLENDAVQIHSFTDAVADNPLVEDLLLVSEAPLDLTITFADYDGANYTNDEIVFTGTLAKVGKVGKAISATFNAGPAVLENQLPKMIRGIMCNHLTGPPTDGSTEFLISVGCGQPNGGIQLTRDNFKFTAIIEAPISSAFPFVLHINTLTAPGGGSPLPGGADVDWFAFGWVEWTLAGRVQRRAIIKSTARGATLKTALTLAKWFYGTPSVGDSVTLYPGCDGLRKTCQSAKFLNDLNFGGEPFTPIGNPSLTKLATNPASGAKK